MSSLTAVCYPVKIGENFRYKPRDERVGVYKQLWSFRVAPDLSPPPLYTSACPACNFAFFRTFPAVVVALSVGYGLLLLLLLQSTSRDAVRFAVVAGACVIF